MPSDLVRTTWERLHTVSSNVEAWGILQELVDTIMRECEPAHSLLRSLADDYENYLYTSVFSPDTDLKLRERFPTLYTALMYLDTVQGNLEGG